MNQANVAMLEQAAPLLEELPDEVVFVGGATVELWVTDPAPPEFRPTKDIDVIVEIATRTAYYRFEEQLRAAGFVNAPEDGVICRFRHSDLGFLLDAMPTEASILGFENRWQREAFPHAAEVALPSGQLIRAIPPAFLLATKLEAYAARGKGDLYGSKDFEDSMRLIDGREEIVGEVSAAPEELRSYVATELGKLLGQPTFDAAAEGALAGGVESLARLEDVLRPRIEAIGGLQA